jgi:transposase
MCFPRPYLHPGAVIPLKRTRKVQREFDKGLYKQRNRIERCFSKLKCFPRFATRYEKSNTSFKALVALACTWICLQLYVDTAEQTEAGRPADPDLH